ncbi:ATF2 factor, partial [Illadopsis cleaveri]|nr:ATF2 factor [Illadopsis cleaveri]
GALDMSLPSTPDIKIKEEEPVEVDSSPPDSPASRPRSPQHKDKVGLSPRAGNVPLPCPNPSVPAPLTAGPAHGHGAQHPRHPRAPHQQQWVPVALRTGSALRGQDGEWQGGLDTAGLDTGVPWAGHCCPFGQPSWGQLWLESAAVPIASGVAAGRQGLPRALRAPLMSLLLPWQRLKASLAASSSLNGGGLAAGSASSMVSARPEQSQILVQHPDAPSPAQPQVSPAQPTPSTGGRRRRAADEDPDERRQRFLERNRA